MSTAGWIEAKPVIVYAFGLIFGFLILASAATLGLQRWRGGLEVVWLRIKTWWIMAAILAVAMLGRQWITICFFALLSFLALREFLSLIPTRRADRIILLVAFLAIPLQYWLVYAKWYGLFITLIPVFGFLLFPSLMAATGQTDGFLKAVSSVHWGLMTAVFSISHAAYLLALPAEGNPRAGGMGLLLYLLVLTQLNDVLQFLWGKSLGRRKITPAVSPNKTWEGMLGGLASSTVLSWLIAPWLTPLDLPQSLWMGALLSAAGFLGDINMSAVKRDIRVKDSGSILPGHGGILDRVDSLTFTAPLMFHIVYYLHY